MKPLVITRHENETEWNNAKMLKLIKISLYNMNNAAAFSMFNILMQHYQ